MSILNNLNNVCRIDASCPASREDEITALKNFSPIKVPKDYLDLIREMTRVQICLDDDKYLRIWGADACIEKNDLFSIQKYMPKSLAIGDDEGEYALLYAYGRQGFGLYAVAFNDPGVDEMVYISKSLEEMLVSGVGIDVFNEL